MVVGLVLVVAALVAIVARPGQDNARPTLAPPAAGQATTVPIDQAPAGLVMVVDRVGTPRAVVLLVPALDGRGGDLVHIPLGTLFPGPGGAEVAVRDLGLRDGVTGVRDALGALLQVELVPEAVPVTEMPAGFGTGAGSDLDVIAADQPVWDRWLVAIRAGSTDEPSPAVLGSLGDELLELSKGDVVHHVLPVEVVGPSTERVRTADLDGLIARVFPGHP